MGLQGVTEKPAEVKPAGQKTTEQKVIETPTDKSVFVETKENKGSEVTKPKREQNMFLHSDTTSKNWFKKWLADEDKFATDGKDDGQISFKEKMESFGKGLICMVKATVNHPIMTAATITAGAGLTILTGGAITPVLITLGACTGAGLIGYGSYKAATAKTDGEAKQAWENIGQGTFTLATSTLSAKSALKSAENAGVTSAQGAKNLNCIQATIQSVKSTPEALKVSSLNAKGNILTWTTGKLHANANVMRKDVKYAYSKATESKAYKFDPNGTPEEVLAKNPYVKYDAAAQKYYVATSCGEKSYLGKDYVVMEYAPNDVNAVSASDFNASYVDKTAFADSGARNYMNTDKMQPGKWISVVKQAPVRYKLVPEGTKYVGKEGPATLQHNSLLMIDKDGSPYQNTIQKFIQRNGDLPLKDAMNLSQTYPEECSMANLIKNKVINDAYINTMVYTDPAQYLQAYGITLTRDWDPWEHDCSFTLSKGDKSVTITAYPPHATEDIKAALVIRDYMGQGSIMDDLVSDDRVRRLITKPIEEYLLPDYTVNQLKELVK